MDWIFKHILRHDRLMHFFLRSLIFTFSTIVFSSLISLAIVFIIGFGKELYDLLIKKTKFDIVDLFYTFMLGAIVNLINYL